MQTLTTVAIWTALLVGGFCMVTGAATISSQIYCLSSGQSFFALTDRVANTGCRPDHTVEALREYNRIMGEIARALTQGGK